MKKIISHFALTLVAITIVLFVAELVVRMFYKENTVLFPRYHTAGQYGEFALRKMRPGSVFWHTSPDGRWKFTINKQGFRNNRDFDYPKQDGTVRVLSLGDSHTQGYEVRQDFTFSAIIEKYLKTHGYDAEVINAGVSGFSTAEELVFLENEGVKYKPDFVVLGFYANDFQDNIKANLFKLNKDGELVLQSITHIPGVKIQDIIYSVPFVKWLGENSYFYSLLFNNTWAYFKTRLREKSTERTVEYAIPTVEKNSDYETALTSALLKRMYLFCKNNNIKFIILDIPRKKNNNAIDNSLPGIISDQITTYCDDYISGKLLLDDYVGVEEIHMPHGQNHISEFSHALLGVGVAKKILLQKTE